QLWTVFEAHYDTKTKLDYGSKLCENLLFDRTKILNGYTIKVSVYVPKRLLISKRKYTKDSNITEMGNRMGKLQAKTIGVFTKYLNISMLTVFNSWNHSANDIYPMLIDRRLELSLVPALPEKKLAGLIFYLSYPLKYFYDEII
ncbi:GSCOCG00009846001-RA-CDS, partial [Cotesia congregata]